MSQTIIFNSNNGSQTGNRLCGTWINHSIVPCMDIQGAYLDSNYLLVGIWMRVKLEKINKRCVVYTGRFYIDKLEDRSQRNKFDNEFKDVFQRKKVIADADVYGD